MNAIATHAQHVRFLNILPRIEAHAEIIFRDIKCAQQRADNIAEVIALSWKWFLRLCRQGKNIEDFPTVFATLVVRAVISGRKVAGMNKSKDVLNPLTQRRKGFTVARFPDYTSGNQLAEALIDNTITPVPDQAAFRIDWPGWVRTRTERDRRIIRDFMAGEKTLHVSKKYGISPGRVSQLRQEFHDDWQRFTSDASV